MKKFMECKVTRKKIVSLLLLLALFLSSFANTGTVIKAEAATQKEGVVAEQDETETKAQTQYGIVVDYPENGSEIYENLEDYPTGASEAEEVSGENTVDTVKELRDELAEDGSASVLSEESAAGGTNTVYPSAVDNSTNENSKYFPSIISQKGSSCVCAAFVYTMGTYTINKARDLDSSKAENKLSPYFMYNMIRSGASGDDWCYFSDAPAYMEKIGAPSLKLIPDTYSNYNSNLHSLYPKEEIWSEAGTNRIKDYICLQNISSSGTPITSPKDSDLNLIKEALNAGKIVGMGAYFRTFNYSTIPSASESHPGENIVDRCDKYVSSGSGRDYGNHAMVIVGYDDKIWTDINHDGKAQTGEYGAFKIANSHGSNYMNQGFVWAAYDTINAVSSVLTSEDETRINAAVEEGVLSCPKVSSEDRECLFMSGCTYTYTAEKKEDTTAGTFLVLDFDNANSYNIKIRIDAKNKDTGSSAGYYTFSVPYNWHKNYSFSGKTSVTSDTIAIDLTNVISNTNADTLLNDYDYTVKISNTGTSNVSYVINSMTIKKDGEERAYVTPEDLENNNTIAARKSKTYSLKNSGDDTNTATVYYENSSWNQAYIHYKVGDGQWTSVPGKQMSSSTEQKGYTWKYQIDLGDSDRATVCFNNGNGNWDSRNGANYTVYAGTYGVKNQTVTKLGAVTPTNKPTVTPTKKPTATPTKKPTATPTKKPTATPTNKPTATPTIMPTANKSTIYYSNASWNQAYIHFKTNNGNWTAVPGVKMEDNTSGNGYTWKYVIDLNNADGATLCFNNGNGSWDSRNGANYSVGKGSYGISNGTIAQLQEGISVKVSANKEVGGTFTTSVFTAQAENGTAPYTYQFAVVNSGTTPSETSYVGVNGNTYEYTPYTARECTIYVIATDAAGETAQASMNYKVEGAKWGEFTATANDHKVGTVVKLNAEYLNYKTDIKNYYSFAIEKDGAKIDYYAGKTGYLEWTPQEEGTYIITARFHGYMGDMYETSMDYTVSNGNTVTVYYNSNWDNAYIHYRVGNGEWTSVPGVKMTPTTEMSGYNYKFTIELDQADNATVCFNNGNGNWDSRNGSNYTVQAGTYGIKNGVVSQLK